MPQDISRLEQALREAHNAGDTAAAQRLAQAIRNSRADQGPQAPEMAPSPTPEPADPMASVPTEINGVPLSFGMRQEILRGRSVEDPREKRLIAARIAGRLAAEADDGGNFADRFMRRGFGAALRGFGAGLFGLGDLAAAQASTVKNVFDEGGMNFGEALEAQREFRRALEGQEPIAAAVGEVAGAITGGGLAAAGVRAGARQVGARGVERALAITPGQRGRNVLRLAAAGAGAGAVTEGVTEGEPVQGGVIGGVAGPLGAGLVRGAQVTGRAVRDLLQDPASKGLRVMASRLGETAEEMGRRFLEFQAVTGRKPSIADISNPQAVAELRDMISERTSAVAIAREGAEAATRRQPAEIAEQVTEGRVATTEAVRRARQARLAERQFAQANDAEITFDPDQVQSLLADPDLRRALPPTLTRRLDEKLDVPEDSTVTLTGLDVNDIRKALRDRARGATGADRIFGELADEVENIARGQSPEFARAIDQFRRRALQAEGVTVGRQGIAQRTQDFQATARGLAEGREAAFSLSGIRAGLRSGLADAALQSASQARSLVNRLAGDTGLVRRLREVLPEREVNRLQRLGELQTRAIENLRTLAPGLRGQEEAGVRDAVRDAVSAVVVAGGQTGGAFKATLFQRALQRLAPRISERVAQQLARDAFDPQKTQAVIGALQRAGVSPEDIFDTYVTSTVGGILATSDAN